MEKLVKEIFGEEYSLTFLGSKDEYEAYIVMRNQNRMVFTFEYNKCLNMIYGINIIDSTWASSSYSCSELSDFIKKVEQHV